MFFRSNARQATGLLSRNPIKSRRRLFRPMAAAAVSSLALSLGLPQASQAGSADLPLIKVLVGFPAGAGTDALARLYAEALGKELGSNVVVENRPGAGGQIAAVALKNAPADGSTLMMAIDHQIVMLGHIMENPGFNALQDFAPIVQTATYNLCVAVNPEVKATNVKEWAQRVRETPRIGNIGVPSLGSNAHFIGDVLAEHLDVPVNVIPYRGAAPLITDVIGGHVDTIAMPCGDPLVRNHMAGRLRIIGVAAERRLPALPDVPALAESGVESPSDYFLGVYASAHVPAEVLQKLRNASLRALKAPGMREKLAATGMEPHVATADELDAVARRSVKVWGDRIQKSGFKPQ